MLVRSGAVDVIVVDSVAALTPKAEIEGEMGDSHMGLQARLMSQALRKLTGNIKRSNCLVIFINQIRMKIGVMFGNPETTTGGNALKFYASVRLDIRRIGSIKKGEEVIGSETRVKVVKNKVAPPFKMAEFEILYGNGISREGEIVDLGVKQNIIEKSGAWYSFKGDRIGQGKENARDFLLEHKDIAADIEKHIRAAQLPRRRARSRCRRHDRGGGCGAPSLTRRGSGRGRLQARRARAARAPRAQPPRARLASSRARGFPADVDRRRARRARATRCARDGAIHRQLRPLARREGPRPAAHPRGARAARHRRSRGGRGRARRGRRLARGDPRRARRKRFGPELAARFHASAPAKPDSCSTAASTARRSAPHWNHGDSD